MYYHRPEGVSVHDGFPNAATDGALQPLNLHQLLIKNPISTFFIRAAGDILAVDRSLSPKPTDQMVWSHQGQLRVSSVSLMPTDAEAWGVVTARITQLRWQT
jgi:hypothetical protein